MPSGGARYNSGPAPDPGALRRDRPLDQAQWINLPGDGYDGQPPDWPLSVGGPFYARERELWEDLWCKPQALMWARLGQRHEVAMFCRVFAAAEEPGSPVTLQPIVLRYLDSLGLSTAGMARHRWRIVPALDTNTAPTSPAESSPATPRRSARDRLKVVAPENG